MCQSNYRCWAGFRQWIKRKAAQLFMRTPLEMANEELKKENWRLYEHKRENQRLRHDVSSLRMGFENVQRKLRALEVKNYELRAEVAHLKGEELYAPAD